MRHVLALLILTVLSCGCAKLTHLPQLLTLKAYSDNKDLQAKYVKDQDKKFEKLLRLAKGDSIAQYPDKKSFLKEFGDPIFSKEVVREGTPYALWLYRYAAQLKDSEKVYLYFDEDEKLHDWEYIVPKE